MVTNSQYQIGGVTEEVYKEVVNSNLWLQGIDSSSDKVLSCDDGMVLLDPKYSGHVYVGGLNIYSHSGESITFSISSTGNLATREDAAD